MHNPWVVFAGNRHILFHAKLVLNKYGISQSNTILVISTANPLIRAQLGEVVRRDDWKAVYDPFEAYHIYNANKLIKWMINMGHSVNWILDLVRLRRAISYIRKIVLDYPYVGAVISGIYASEIDRTYLNLVDHERYILVDDGNMTIITANGRKNEELINYKRVMGVNSHRVYDGWKGKLKVILLRNFAGIIDRGSESIEFFTSHNNIKIGNNDRIIANKYEDMHRSAVINPRLVHFLGLPARARNILSETSFRAILRQVRRRYEGRPVFYFAHPMEGDEERVIVESIWPEAEWHDNTEPYESALLRSEQWPEIVSAFYSSVLMNLINADLEGIKFEIIRLPVNLIEGERRQELVSSIYESIGHLNSDKVEIIKVFG